MPEEPDRPAQALVGAYPDGHAAADLAGALARAGIDPALVHVARDEDEVESLRAEMDEEVNRSLVAPVAGILYSREATKATVVLGPLLVGAGLVVGLLVALVPFGGLDGWVRALIAGSCGAGVGAVVAVVVLPAMAVRRHDVPLAAQRGVVVRVDTWSPRVEEAMVAARPLRLDRIDGEGRRLGSVVTEEGRTPGGIVEEVGRNFAREHRVPPERRVR